VSKLRLPIAALSGVLFASGLIVAGVVRPAVVLHAFALDHQWDPSAYVMFLGALLTHVPLSQWAHRRGSSLDGTSVHSTQGVIDAKLVTGALIFGAGWGIGGICPGPLLTSLLTLSPTVLVFAAGYGFGVMLYVTFQRKR